MLSVFLGWLRAAWSFIVQWFQTACCPQETDKNDETESRERLLSADGHISAPIGQQGLSTPAAGQAAKRGSVGAYATTPAKDTTVIVMRHGHR